MIPALLAGAGLGLQVGGMYQSHKALEKQEKYQKKMREKEEREGRRQALARAIGADENYMPRREPGPPSTKDEMVKKGIMEMIGYSLNDYLANPEKYNAMFAGQPSPAQQQQSFDYQEGYGA